MMIRKHNQVLIVIEMTEEQSKSLCTALQKSSKIVMNTDEGQALDQKEHEVLNDLRVSLLNS